MLLKKAVLDGNVGEPCCWECWLATVVAACFNVEGEWIAFTIVGAARLQDLDAERSCC